MRAPRARPALLSLACGILTIACTTGRTETVAGGDVAPSLARARWTATLNPEGGTGVMGSAVVEPTADPRRTQIRVTVQGAPPSTNLPWRIHRGSCSTDLGVYGSAGSYPMLGTSGDGRAQIQTVLSVAPPTDGSYVVKIFAGPGSETIIACGDLQQESIGG